MTGEEIADGVAAVLNAIEAPQQEFTAVNVETPETHREEDGLQVQVWPYAITEQEIDRGGGWMMQCEVQILVTAPLITGRGRREMIALCSQLRESLRAVEIEGARHRRTEFEALWDGEAQRARTMFQASMRAVFEVIN